MSFGFGKQVEMDFDAALETVTDELQKEGFGVLSEIDVSAKMKEKLDRDMPQYRILGACNPPLAWEAMQCTRSRRRRRQGTRGLHGSGQRPVARRPSRRRATGGAGQGKAGATNRERNVHCENSCSKN